MAWLREDTRGMTLERRMNWLRKNEWPDFKKTHGLTPKSHGSTSKRLADSEKIHDLTSRTLMDWLRTVSWADFKNTYGLISKILKAQVRKKTHGPNSWRLTSVFKNIQYLTMRTLVTWLKKKIWLWVSWLPGDSWPEFEMCSTRSIPAPWLPFMSNTRTSILLNYLVSYFLPHRHFPFSHHHHGHLLFIASSHESLWQCMFVSCNPNSPPAALWPYVDIKEIVFSTFTWNMRNINKT